MNGFICSEMLLTAEQNFDPEYPFSFSITQTLSELLNMLPHLRPQKTKDRNNQKYSAMESRENIAFHKTQSRQHELVNMLPHLRPPKTKDRNKQKYSAMKSQENTAFHKTQSRGISTTRQYLTVDAIKTLVVSLVLFRIDDCSSLLAGLPL